MPTITQDHVLLLLQTDSNKLLMHWKGPFRVVGKVGQHDYHLGVNGREKLFHINLLKKYKREIRHASALGGAAMTDVGERDPEVEGEILIPELASGETYNNVDVHPGLDADKKWDVEQI